MLRSWAVGEERLVSLDCALAQVQLTMPLGLLAVDEVKAFGLDLTIDESTGERSTV